MKVTFKELKTAVNKYASEAHYLFCSKETTERVDLKRLQQITEDLFEMSAEWEITFDVMFKHLPEHFVLQLVRNTRLASALCGLATEQDVKDKLFRDALDDYFELNFVALQEGVCAYYHKYLSGSEEENGK